MHPTRTLPPKPLIRQPVRPTFTSYIHRPKRARIPAAAATPSKETTDLIKPTFDVHVGTPTSAGGTRLINHRPGYVNTATRGQEFTIVQCKVFRGAWVVRYIRCHVQRQINVCETCGPSERDLRYGLHQALEDSRERSSSTPERSVSGHTTS